MWLCHGEFNINLIHIHLYVPSDKKTTLSIRMPDQNLYNVFNDVIYMDNY